MKLFEDHEVNTGRQAFLDVAKSLSILFMVLVHVLLYVAIPEDAVGEAGLTFLLFALLTPVALVLYLPLTVWLAAHDWACAKRENKETK